jgi:hypothetical protein
LSPSPDYSVAVLSALGEPVSVGLVRVLGALLVSGAVADGWVDACGSGALLVSAPPQPVRARVAAVAAAARAYVKRLVISAVSWGRRWRSASVVGGVRRENGLEL